MLLDMYYKHVIVHVQVQKEQQLQTTVQNFTSSSRRVGEAELHMLSELE
jgi:hypothetical protein